MEYIKAIYLVSKPFITYIGIKSGFMIGTYSLEWYTGRAYAKYCIGEGFEGYYNHVWNLASPGCTGLLMSHISFLGIFIASVGLTFLSGIMYVYKNHMKEEYINTKNILEEIKRLK